MPSDVIRRWTPVRVKKTRETKDQSPVLIQPEPTRLPGSLPVELAIILRDNQGEWRGGRHNVAIFAFRRQNQSIGSKFGSLPGVQKPAADVALDPARAALHRG